MPIVTLTSDFGTADHYVAVMKGALLSKSKDLTLVDISHSVDSFDITLAAYLIKNTYLFYPPDTIHLVAVNSFYDENPRFLALKHHGHYFIGPDNGVFSLLFDEIPSEKFQLELEVENLASLCQLFADAVNHIATEKALLDIGPIVGSINERITLQPVITNNQIRGSVIHIDKYDNVILNISRELFDRVHLGRDFALYFKRHDPILTLSKHYSDVAPGETLCIFNGAGYLEIAVNFGKAATLLGLDIDDTVQINFA